MWHPFDIMPQELALTDAVRGASVVGPCRLVFGERVTRWFKDKSSADQQWPPTVDQKPGLTIIRRPADDGTHALEIQHSWVLTNTQTMSGRMICRADGWRSPLKWEFTQTFLTDKNKPLVPPLTETGRWQDGTLERTTKGSAGEVRKTAKVSQLASTYGLMAGFPKVDEATGSAGLIQEALTFCPEATLQPVPSILQENPLAKGLEGFVLKSADGFPSDYWVNANGAVVYVCYGPNRVFVLDKVEVLS